MNGGSGQLPELYYFPDEDTTDKKCLDSLYGQEKNYMKSMCLSEIEDYLFETVDFKDFPNTDIFSTDTLYMP
jgi:hypothetical protein